MDLLINGEPRALDTSECANLAELVALVERHDCDGPETVVVEMEVDGAHLDGDQLASLESFPVDGLSRVEIQRRSSQAVARSVLEQGSAYAARIVDVIEKTAAHYRRGRSDLGHELLASVSDSLSVLTGITASVANVLVAEAEELGAIQAEIFPCLNQLVEAQCSDDAILIADLLDYEVAPRVAGWGTLMGELIKPLDPTTPVDVSN